jgi:hypothetical protein
MAFTKQGLVSQATRLCKPMYATSPCYFLLMHCDDQAWAAKRAFALPFRGSSCWRTIGGAICLPGPNNQKCLKEFHRLSFSA